MPRQIATNTVQPRTATRLARVLWAIYLLLQTAVLVVAFLARSYSNPAETIPLFSAIPSPTMSRQGQRVPHEYAQSQ